MCICVALLRSTYMRCVNILTAMQRTVSDAISLHSSIQCSYTQRWATLNFATCSRSIAPSFLRIRAGTAAPPVFRVRNCPSRPINGGMHTHLKLPNWHQKMNELKGVIDILRAMKLRSVLIKTQKNNAH